MHRRQQPAVGMMTLVEVWRSLAGRKDVPGGSAKDSIGQTRLRICGGITVECDPASIMVGDDVNHEIQRVGRLELGIAERSRELTRSEERRVGKGCRYAEWAEH